MVEFMVLGLPRSGTTWASAWLTTEVSACWHDPLYRVHYSDWDVVLGASRKVGVACTGVWRWREWLAQHPAKKVILHRPLGEVRESMREIGLPDIDLERAEEELGLIEGLHVDHVELFEAARARRIWDHLELGAEFDELRHELLVDIEMQPKFSGLSVGLEVTRRLHEELSRL